MSSRRRVLFETAVNPQWAPVLTSAPLELILAEDLPDLCSEHGLPAVETRSCTVRTNGPGSELPTVRSFLRSMRWPWQPRESRGPDALLRFACPACEYCLYEVRRFRRFALLAVLAIILTFAAIAAARLLHLDQLYLPLAFVVVPGCFPLALAAAIVTWSRSGYFADVWLTDSTDHLTVSAHPDFAAAVEQRRFDDRRKPAPPSAR
ncbi:hypothetical protein [Nocardia brasiliensis]|uniref:hypothetical protein n=1 Tax=Nocardia brasiliensis TaxID=37326 RepID=UPI0024538BC1|nr:hypothetical protein [Nocardia brasiliensis]